MSPVLRSAGIGPVRLPSFVRRVRSGLVPAAAILLASVGWIGCAEKASSNRAADEEPAATTMAAASSAPRPYRYGVAAAADGTARAKAGEMAVDLAAPSAAHRGATPQALVEEPDARPALEHAILDPNGRYATTYRPGGGHLAAFESAIARGIIPASEREIVSDVGDAYAGTIDKPTDHAMAIKADFERSLVSPSGGDVHLRLDLRSTPIHHAKERPHLAVAVVLDVSGSMAGARIDAARQAAEALVDRLDASDQVSFVTFSTNATLVIPVESVGPNRDAIKKTIEGVHEGGGTNLGAGLQLGYTELHKSSVPDDAERVTVLLSDGRANEGITSQKELSDLALHAFEDGIQTSTFGLGTDYDGLLMSSIAEEGSGGYYYLRDPEQIPPAVATEIEKRLDPVATAVEVRVRLKPGVDVLEAYGSRKLTRDEAANVRSTEVAIDKYAEKHDHIGADRQDDRDGGMRFFIPAFARDDRHAILLKLHLPAGVTEKEVAVVEIKYKDRVSRANVVDEVPVKIGYAASDADSARTVDASVERTVQGFEAGEALMDASRAVASGDMSKADRILSSARRSSKLRRPR